MPTLHIATLSSFDAGSFTASVNLVGSIHMHLDGVPVNRAIASGEMVAGREVTVLILDTTKATDARVIAVYG